MKLLLPPTLSFPRAEDAPDGIDIEAADAAREAARIEEGFVLERFEDRSWTYFARVNVDAPRLWDVFESLVGALPERVGPIVGSHGEEPALLPYQPRADALSVLRLYRTELSLDGFLEFGLIHQTDAITEEVFVPSAKYVKVWGRDEDGFRERMKAFGIDEVPDLRFVDEFPLMSCSLGVIDTKALHFTTVLDAIGERLTDIPTTRDPKPLSQ